MGQGGGTVSNCLGTLQTLVTTRTERRLRDVRIYDFKPPPLPLSRAGPFTRISESNRRRIRKDEPQYVAAGGPARETENNAKS